MFFAQTLLADEFWIWPQVHIANYDQSENTLYVLRGLFEYRKKQFRFIEQGNSLQNVKAKLVLVYRLRKLPPVDFLNEVIQKDLKIWSVRNTQVIGIQFDFDSPSKKLKLYTNWLHDFKSGLSPNLQVSLTGLVDWLRHSPSKELEALQAEVNFIAFQLYTHGHAYPDLKMRIKDLEVLKHPFKVGVLDESSKKTLLHELKNKNYLSMILFKGSSR